MKETGSAVKKGSRYCHSTALISHRTRALVSVTDFPPYVLSVASLVARLNSL